MILPALNTIGHPIGRMHAGVLRGQAPPITGPVEDPGAKSMPFLGRGDIPGDSISEGLAYDVLLTARGIPAWLQRPQFSRMYMRKQAAVKRPNILWHMMWSLLGGAQKGPGPTMSIVGDPEIDDAAQRVLMRGGNDRYERDYLHAVTNRASHQLTADSYGQLSRTMRERLTPEPEPENLNILMGGLL